MYKVLIRVEESCFYCGQIKREKVWRPISGSDGTIVTFTKEEAEKYVETYSAGRYANEEDFRIVEA